MGNVLSGLSLGMQGVVSLRLICNLWMSPDFKAFLPPQPWRPLEDLRERVTGSRGCQGSWGHSRSPWKHPYMALGNTHSCSYPARRGPGVGQDGHSGSGEGLQRSRDKTELGAMLSPDEGCISKGLGGRLGPGAEKKGWPWVVLPKGWMPAAILALGGWGGGRPLREKFNSTPPTFPHYAHLSHSPLQIPSKTSLKWRGTWHD